MEGRLRKATLRVDSVRSASFATIRAWLSTPAGRPHRHERDKSKGIADLLSLTAVVLRPSHADVQWSQSMEKLEFTLCHAR